MGFFSNAKADNADTYYRIAKDNGCIARKDGHIHALLFNSLSGWATDLSGIDEVYTQQVDRILECLQKDGFEIVDLKFNSMPNEGMSGVKDRFQTVILYR